MISGQNNVVNVEENFLTVPAESKSNEPAEQVEKVEEVIFIRRQFQAPSLLEIRFARLKKALRNRSVSII